MTLPTDYHFEPIHDLGNPPGYLYEVMANHIAERIAAGELDENTPLPAERRLAATHGVSLGTARRATQVLRERGLVFTVRSKGTFIAPYRSRDAQPATARTSNTVDSKRTRQNSRIVSTAAVEVMPTPAPSSSTWSPGRTAPETVR